MNSIHYEPLAYTFDFRSKVAFDLRAPIVGKAPDDFLALHWNWELLSLRYGDKIVFPLIDMPTSGKFNVDYREHEKCMPLGEFIALARSGPAKPCYLAYLRPSEIHRDLQIDANFEVLGSQPSSATDTRIWMGSKGTNSGLHSDLKDNIFVQVQGRKLLYLVAPEYTKFIYPQVDNIVNSEVEFPDPELSVYPKLAHIQIQKHIVCRGDVVFIPRGWWHCLVSLEDSISVNHWYGPPISDKQYIQMIKEQGFLYSVRTMIDMVRYGVLKILPKNDFFFTPPPNGARLYSYLKNGNFSLDNDPVKD